MNKINDGGSAFPLPDLSGYGMGPAELMSGLSKREWFAGTATDADILKFQEWDVEGPKFTRVQARYRFTDAMLSESQKGGV